MITVEEMAKLGTFSIDWFAAAFEGVVVPDSVKTASIRICQSYLLNGQADPGYIANLINQEVCND